MNLSSTATAIPASAATFTTPSKEKAYAIFNGHIGYLYAPWSTRLTLFGNNLPVYRYHVQQFQDDFGTTKILAAPREFGLRLKWDF